MRCVPAVTERFVVPLPRSISTTRIDLRIVNASVAERSRRAGFELLLDGAMDEEGERGNKNVRLHAISGLMIDRRHVDHVLEVGEGAFDFREFLVEAHRVSGGQIGLFGLDDVFALLSRRRSPNRPNDKFCSAIATLRIDQSATSRITQLTVKKIAKLRPSHSVALKMCASPSDFAGAGY